MVLEEGKEDIAFCTGVGEEIWMTILEKAWAKLYRSYGCIIGGYG